MSRYNDNNTPLTKALFLEKLSIHGADFARWEGVNADEARKFLDGHESVQAEYEKAKALDDVLARYEVPDDFKAEALIGKVSEKIESGKLASFAEAQKNAERRKQGMLYYWGGGLAVAASLMVLFFMQPAAGPDIPQSVEVEEINSASYSQQHASADATEDKDIERLFAAWDRSLAEDLKQREIISLWDDVDKNNVQISSASTAAGQASEEPRDGASQTQDYKMDAGADKTEIESFIEEHYIPTVQDDVLEREMDLWELYLNSEDQG